MIYIYRHTPHKYRHKYQVFEQELTESLAYVYDLQLAFRIKVKTMLERYQFRFIGGSADGMRLSVTRPEAIIGISYRSGNDGKQCEYIRVGPTFVYIGLIIQNKQLYEIQCRKSYNQ